MTDLKDMTTDEKLDAIFAATVGGAKENLAATVQVMNNQAALAEIAAGGGVPEGEDGEWIYNANGTKVRNPDWDGHNPDYWDLQQLDIEVIDTTGIPLVRGVDLGGHQYNIDYGFDSYHLLEMENESF